MNKTYSEKLKDPRWQKKRLTVMQRADFACEFCGNKTQTLHVHHLKYSGQPWDAPDDALECLCEFHHNEVHSEGGLLHGFKFLGRASIAKSFIDSVVAARVSGVLLEEITAAIQALKK